MRKSKRKFKVPFIEQMNQSECGICCLNMVLSYYNYNVDLHELRNHFGNGRDGLELLKIKQFAAEKGFDSKAVKMSVDMFYEQKFPYPAIAFFDQKHYVIIEKVKGKNFFILDPAHGKLKLNEQEFNRRFSNYILFLQPNDSFKMLKKQADESIWKKLIYPYKKILVLIFICSLLLQGISIGIPILIQNVIDSIITYNQTELLKMFAITFLIVILLQVLLTAIKNSILVIFQSRMDFGLMDNFINHLFKLPLSFFETRSRGDLIYRANSNVRIREFLSQNIISSIINVFLVIFVFVYMLTQSTLLALTLLSIGLLQICIVLLSKKRLNILTQSEIVNQTNISGYMTEVLGGVSTIKSLGIETQIYHKWDTLFNKQIRSTKEKEYFKIKIDSINNLLNFSAPILILLLGIYQVTNGTISLGTLFAFQSLSMSFLSPLSSIIMVVGDLITIETLINRINDILKTQTEDNNLNAENVNLKGNIELQNVSFKYHKSGEEILNNISLKIEAGEKVGIVGKSGSGKSTLASLLVGLYSPSTGDIYFDGLNYNSINKTDFRNKIGVVLQENFLFNRSIYENIIIHKPKTSITDVEWAIKCADLEDDIKKLPMGIHTKISETGTNFSGGQKQRIALARALVGKPAIFLLDEATSALDSITESNIERNIQDLNCTRVVIAHRMSTIVDADKIVVLDNGCIVAEGTHEELIDSSNHYQELYHRSLQSKIPMVN
ncbi:peptidase domain-containing ABC transporter [Terribacillus saccharophilus]|uniref:Uncharacterized protein n=1 Tax=Terribacillus saccharophilus TaxID=361277 RepID=A0A268AG81_9BACI|nr:peptidase domain-containing ABC transporter [Terribacillus saccharophilus]PAD23143.1 hypothetical protein CHH64_00570 [Terribacillus saccharophilus]